MYTTAVQVVTAAAAAAAAANAVTQSSNHTVSMMPTTPRLKWRQARARASSAAASTSHWVTSQLNQLGSMPAPMPMTTSISAPNNSSHVDAMRHQVTWPFEQNLDDQADFASRIIYALWCRERPATLPQLPADGTGPSTTMLTAHIQSDWAEFACGQPAPSEFQKFTHELLSITQLHPSVTLLAIYYVYRLVLSNPTIRGASGSEMRVWTVALALANKYLDDHTYRASTWRQLTGLATKELTQMEFEMLRALNWSLYTTHDAFVAWSHWLVALRRRYEHDLQSRMPISPVPLTPTRAAKRHWTHLDEQQHGHTLATSQAIYSPGPRSAGAGEAFSWPAPPLPPSSTASHSAMEVSYESGAVESGPLVATRRRRTSRSGAMPVAWAVASSGAPVPSSTAVTVAPARVSMPDVVLNMELHPPTTSVLPPALLPVDVALASQMRVPVSQTESTTTCYATNTPTHHVSMMTQAHVMPTGITTTATNAAYGLTNRSGVANWPSGQDNTCASANVRPTGMSASHMPCPMSNTTSVAVDANHGLLTPVDGQPIGSRLMSATDMKWTPGLALAQRSSRRAPPPPALQMPQPCTGFALTDHQRSHVTDTVTPTRSTPTATTINYASNAIMSGMDVSSQPSMEKATDMSNAAAAVVISAYQHAMSSVSSVPASTSMPFPTVQPMPPLAIHPTTKSTVTPPPSRGPSKQTSATMSMPVPYQYTSSVQPMTTTATSLECAPMPTYHALAIAPDTVKASYATSTPFRMPTYEPAIGYVA
jgi:hypothetical protein